MVAAIRDGAAVNGAALQSMKDVMYPKTIDLVCSAHMLDNVGKRFQTPLLTELSQWWVSLFSRSPAARLAWRERTSTDIKTCNNTRWWSLWEVQNHLLLHFGDVESFLQDLEACPAARQHLLDVLHNEHQHKQLCMELVITINAGLPIVEKTYSMEGNGEIIVEAYENLQQLATSAALKNFPNAKAMAKKFAGDDDAAAEAIFQADLRCVQPAMTYFLQKFNHCDSPLFNMVRLFKAIRLFCPLVVRRLQPDLNHIDELRLLPALDDNVIIQGLKDELPALLVSAADVQACSSRLRWWSEQEKLPYWQSAAKVVFCLMPSSAAAERAFRFYKRRQPTREPGFYQTTSKQCCSFSTIAASECSMNSNILMQHTILLLV